MEQSTADQCYALLSKIRHEPEHVVREAFSPEAMARIDGDLWRKIRTRSDGEPKIRAKFERFKSWDYTAGQSPDGTRYIRTGDGSLFYDYPPRPFYRELIELHRGLIPDGIDWESFGLAIEARHRYERNLRRLRRLGLPAGATVFEVGAYVGYKAIGYARALGPAGRVVALELSPDNARLLKANVEANELTDQITTYHAGAWSEDGETELAFSSEAGTVHGIAQIEGRPAGATHTTVPVRSLASIIDEHAIEHVAFINVQVNGAELEVLEGLAPRADRCAEISITSPYRAPDGTPKNVQAARILSDWGWEVVCGTPTNVRGRNPRLT